MRFGCAVATGDESTATVFNTRAFKADDIKNATKDINTIPRGTNFQMFCASAEAPNSTAVFVFGAPAAAAAVDAPQAAANSGGDTANKQKEPANNVQNQPCPN